ncbi:hypothetical protein R5W60_04605 [Brucella pseudintermedia]|uniref:hypothetical protein n=1 Tax=Brucella pseudintermedia TaxID=370111 RepID=UPI00366FBB9D|nr:hypothetical protein R5W60_04605 [Brucella pseudintermedia]
MQLSEYDARQSEQYKAMRKQLNDLHPGLAAYITIAGVLMIISGFFWGGDQDSNPMFTAGIGLAALLGGGGYWFHCKDTEKRLSREMSSIEAHFASKNKRINWNGDVSDL